MAVKERGVCCGRDDNLPEAVELIRRMDAGERKRRARKEDMIRVVNDREWQDNLLCT